jgi:hypothetical protein
MQKGHDATNTYLKTFKNLKRTLPGCRTTSVLHKYSKNNRNPYERKRLYTGKPTTILFLVLKTPETSPPAHAPPPIFQSCLDSPGFNMSTENSMYSGYVFFFIYILHPSVWTALVVNSPGFNRNWCAEELAVCLCVGAVGALGGLGCLINTSGRRLVRPVESQPSPHQPAWEPPQPS